MTTVSHRQQQQAKDKHHRGAEARARRRWDLLQELDFIQREQVRIGVELQRIIGELTQLDLPETVPALASLDPLEALRAVARHEGWEQVTLADAALRVPTWAELELWAEEGVAEAACEHQCQVEADGTCPHGRESWLVRLGLV